MRRIFECLNVVIVAATVYVIGYAATIEFLDLRQRVEQIEQRLDEPIELKIITPDIITPFGEPTLAPPLVPFPDKNETSSREQHGKGETDCRFRGVS